VNVLVVSGIWPPDVGGPASHAPEVAAYLRSRGHGVEVVTTASRDPEPEEYPVHWATRALPPGLRHANVTRVIARASRRADVVYATGLYVRSALACAATRTPLVFKLTSDPAYERTVWRGGGARQERFLAISRDFAVRRAAHIFTPSRFLRDRALTWGVPVERVSVLPNPAPLLPELPTQAAARARLGVDGDVLSFAGRLSVQKSLELAFEALAQVEGVTLLLAGDGPERARLEGLAASLGERVRFLGAVDRRGVLEVFRAGDAGILTSSWENFPHTLVESLAVGTPVIATAVGGVPEIVRDGENGLLVASGDADALAAAIRRYFSDGALRARLQADAVASVADFSPERVYGELERTLAGAAA
jgi:glycosyltransferase involved in cell wall biosynthesis